MSILQWIFVPCFYCGICKVLKVKVKWRSFLRFIIIFYKNEQNAIENAIKFIKNLLVNTSWYKSFTEFLDNQSINFFVNALIYMIHFRSEITISSISYKFQQSKSVISTVSRAWQLTCDNRKKLNTNRCSCRPKNKFTYVFVLSEPRNYKMNVEFTFYIYLHNFIT